MSEYEQIDCHIPGDRAGQRLDQVLAELLPDYSRARLQAWLREAKIQVDGRPARPRDRVLGGEHITGRWRRRARAKDRPQAIALTIIHEDADILVIDKPAGLVVHPAAGNPDGTLLNALLNHAPGLDTLPRAGLVHRLDKDTSGLLAVAKTERAHVALVEQLQARAMEREYQAVVVGVMTAGGTVDAPLGRHPLDRKRMSVVLTGKPAVTHYRVLRRFRAHSHVLLKLETGRTHQIRVHMAYIRYPLLGDPVYGGRPRLPPAMDEAHIRVLRDFKRQALHAARLALTHPVTGQRMEWHSDLPQDFHRVLDVLALDAEAHAGPSS